MKEIELDMHRSIDNLGKFSVNLKIDSDKRLDDAAVIQLLNEIMNRVGHSCMESGADMIGHIKSCAYDNEERMCSANLTSFRVGVEYENNLQGHGMRSGYVMLHVIVHGLWDPQVRDISMAQIDEIMQANELDYRIIRDYFEEEKRVNEI